MDEEVVTGTDREVVDLVMRDGVTLLPLREVVVDGPEDRYFCEHFQYIFRQQLWTFCFREVAAVEDQDHDQGGVRVWDRGKRKTFRFLTFAEQPKPEGKLIEITFLKIPYLALTLIFSAKPRFNGQASVLALKSTSIVVKLVSSPPTLGPQNIWTRKKPPALSQDSWRPNIIRIPWKFVE